MWWKRISARIKQSKIRHRDKQSVKSVSGYSGNFNDWPIFLLFNLGILFVYESANEHPVSQVLVLSYLTAMYLYLKSSPTLKINVCLQVLGRSTAHMWGKK